MKKAERELRLFQQPKVRGLLAADPHPFNALRFRRHVVDAERDNVAASSPWPAPRGAAPASPPKSLPPTDDVRAAGVRRGEMARRRAAVLRPRHDHTLHVRGQLELAGRRGVDRLDSSRRARALTSPSRCRPLEFVVVRLLRVASRRSARWSGTLTVACWPPLRATSTSTTSPGLRNAIAPGAARRSRRGLPSTETITSPACMPAFFAAEFVVGEVLTRARRRCP